MFLDMRDGFIERHFSMRAEITNCQGRCPVESRVAMEIDAFASGNQRMEIVNREPQPSRHGIGATVLDRSPYE